MWRQAGRKEGENERAGGEEGAQAVLGRLLLPLRGCSSPGGKPAAEGRKAGSIRPGSAREAPRDGPGVPGGVVVMGGPGRWSLVGR